jgi:hypothetical protein
MSETHAIHCYEYVNRPYGAVSEALVKDAVGLFERATTSATGRAHSLVSTLKVRIAGFEVGKKVVVEVKRVDRHAHAPGHMAPEATQLQIDWRAETATALFPAMHATLTIYPLGPNETQLDLQGTYDPPGGAFGDVADRLLGHRIADASVHTFLESLAQRVSEELPPA